MSGFDLNDPIGRKEIISTSDVFLHTDSDASGAGDFVQVLAGTEWSRRGASKDYRRNLIQVLALSDTTASSLTVTPDAQAGEFVQVTLATSVTGTVTIANPTNPPTTTTSQRLTVEVNNGSGGVMGNITFGTAFVTAGITVGKPASTKKRCYSFQWNGVNWVATGSVVTDY